MTSYLLTPFTHFLNFQLTVRFILWITPLKYLALLPRSNSDKESGSPLKQSIATVQMDHQTQERLVLNQYADIPRWVWWKHLYICQRREKFCNISEAGSTSTLGFGVDMSGKMPNRAFAINGRSGTTMVAKRSNQRKTLIKKSSTAYIELSITAARKGRGTIRAPVDYNEEKWNIRVRSRHAHIDWSPSSIQTKKGRPQVTWSSVIAKHFIIPLEFQPE